MNQNLEFPIPKYDKATKKKVAIIGSGISGFAAGINLLKNGFDVSIYEKNSFYGGCCNAYEENGVLFSTRILSWRKPYFNSRDKELAVK